MNCPSRVDEPEGTGYNQNPNVLAADLTTREDLNGIANSRILRRSLDQKDRDEVQIETEDTPKGGKRGEQGGEKGESSGTGMVLLPHAADLEPPYNSGQGLAVGVGKHCMAMVSMISSRLLGVLRKFSRFIGPGFMIAVAYIDPGNYATDVAAGASYRFKLLFIVLMSNIFAIFLQTCRAFLPTWLNISLYILAEIAIIATDIAEVIGTAIAINLLIPQIPLLAGCAISIVDVLITLLFYRPTGSLRGLRAFEFFVMALVLGVVICFCIQLSLITNTSVGDVFKGYLPSSAVVQSDGLYQACGILGATVMPHSLYLGSGIVQPRLYAYDIAHNLTSVSLSDSDITSSKVTYFPSLRAIRHCLIHSIAEVSISLFTFALFINSSILIVAGASLYETPNASDADLFGIYDLLSSSISKAAGTIFALALLLSGVSAGIVCTIAGQMLSEGALNWTIAPWLRRLLTRSISITPSIIIAGAVGARGLSTALQATQVVLSVVLPFVTAPLIYFTARARYMTVGGEGRAGERVVVEDDDGVVVEDRERREEPVIMKNNRVVTGVGIGIWLVVAVMNVANLVLLGKGEG